ncbi:hypothetical protein RW1_094_03520 [Rhodococcus wratislaviensis NBRC 100605]|uniref:Uncharacterized protein n=1 Tax=Rhodococcus wratislaviensis NBRC 100605 TaxID=1219028 RepID=X0QHE5_RHOWR|nr:hypothetical protein RW1_094_03520 [Rhodococcus wratislaviensis NBRC 100605]
MFNDAPAIAAPNPENQGRAASSMTHSPPSSGRRQIPLPTKAVRRQYSAPAVPILPAHFAQTHTPSKTFDAGNKQMHALPSLTVNAIRQLCSPSRMACNLELSSSGALDFELLSDAGLLAPHSPLQRSCADRIAGAR